MGDVHHLVSKPDRLSALLHGFVGVLRVQESVRLACANSVDETARPSDFTVLRLRTKRKRVGCSNGSSAGFAP